jgi:hypothetical protein
MRTNVRVKKLCWRGENTLRNTTNQICKKNQEEMQFSLINKNVTLGMYLQKTQTLYTVRPIPVHTDLGIQSTECNRLANRSGRGKGSGLRNDL